METYKIKGTEVMSFRKYNRSYYQYQITYRICKRNQPEEIRNSEWNTDILYNQMHFWNKRRLTQKVKHGFLEKLVLLEKDITQIEILNEKFVLIPQYNCEIY